MTNLKKIIVSLFCILGICLAESDEMLLIVLVGQSNMSGRGFIEEEDKVKKISQRREL